jgi:hypothetical protein
MENTGLDLTRVNLLVSQGSTTNTSHKVADESSKATYSI